MINDVWEGVYNSFEETHACGLGFNGDTWINKSVERISALKKKTSSMQKEFTCFNHDSPLYLLACVVYGQKGGVTIVDVGGGVGFSYYQVRESLPTNAQFKFYVIDVEAVCKAGEDFFRKFTHIHFQKEFPDNLLDVDIIHFGSSFHYINDWQGYLSAVCRKNSLYISFTDLPAGNIPTFVTEQNYYESKIPVRFFNINEIISKMKYFGYEIIFKSAYQGNIRSDSQELPLDNFPKELRLKNTCNLVFQKMASEND